MAAKAPQKKLQRGKKNEQGEHEGQAVKDETMRTHEEGKLCSEVGKAESGRKD